MELKIGKFKPEYISKMNFYLEALGRQVKKRMKTRVLAYSFVHPGMMRW